MSPTTLSKSTKPHYPVYSKKQDGFYEEIRRRVDTYFLQSKKPKKGGWEVTLKTITLLLTFLGSYFLLLSNWFGGWGTFLCGLIFGLSHVLIVFNIGHDASHNALFKNPKLNQILSYSFNLVGANAYLWNLTHNRIHHSYPNVGDYDADIMQQAPLIRVSPTVPARWFHRYQAFYAPVLYLFYSIFLVFQKDYQDLRFIPKSDSKILENEKHPLKEYLIFFLSKLFYYGYSLVIPLMILDVTLSQFIVGYLVIHFCMSILLIVVLTPVHLVDEAEFAVVNSEGSLEDNWAVHVFKNTTDYARKSKLANLFFGGLNTHLVHHLFPGICHVHYIQLSEILKKTAKEFHLSYQDVSMAEALASHFRLLNRMSREI